MNAPKKGEGIYNVAIIGAGTAGLVTAAGTAGLGGRVALIERHKMGGDCLNFGCVPSKALISSARLIHRISRAQDWGLEKHEPQFQFGKVFERMRSRRAKIAPNDSQERFESLGVDVFRGDACFLSPHEIEVAGQRLRARNFVIAAGSRAGLPKIAGLSDVPYFTNETIFDNLHSKPGSLVVIGGGPIGCELGQVMAQRGKSLSFEAEEIDDLLSMEYEDKRTFAALSLLFPFVDLRNQFHIDHVFPKSRFTLQKLEKAGIEAATAERMIGLANSLPNLQLLDGATNNEKRTSLPKDWSEKQFPNSLEREHYLDKHRMGVIPPGVDGFTSFHGARRELLRNKLEELLMAKGR